MRTKRFLIPLLAFFVAFAATARAQLSVTAGTQIKSESDLVDGKAYLVQQGFTKNYALAYAYVKDNGTYLNTADANTEADLSCVYYFLKTDDGKWVLQNAYTGHYWGIPSPTNDSKNSYVNSRIKSVTTEAEAGLWSLNFDTDGSAFPTALATDGTTTKGIDRAGNFLLGWNTGSGNTNSLKISEVTCDESSSTRNSQLAKKEISVSSTEATSLAVGQWYVMYNRGRKGYLNEVVSSHKLYNYAESPDGKYASANAGYLVRLEKARDGKYYLRTGYDNYFGAIPQNTAVPTEALRSNRITIGTIGSNAGHFYLTGSDGRVIDCQQNGYPVVGWGTEIPTSTGDNNDWAFYPVTLTDAFAPEANEVYTITNASKGSLLYYPAGSTKWVYATKRGGTFDASNANCQWVFYPTDAENEYYIYNVGAGKFAIPYKGSEGYSGGCWMFSPDAVAVAFEKQSDGTYKINSATGTFRMAISEGYPGPVINYNDQYGNYTLTRVEGTDKQTEVEAAVGKLFDNQTPLTAAPTETGWYAVRILKPTDYAGLYVYELDTPITHTNGVTYPLGFYTEYNTRASAANSVYLAKLTKTSSGYSWQMPNGQYIQNSGKPEAGSEEASLTITYDATNHFTLKTSSNVIRPYLLNNNYFMGETSTQDAAYYDLYAVDLTAAGLTAWQVICDNASANEVITCTRSDVSGRTGVYKGGYIFLPADVTPTESDFALDGATKVTIDATAKTVTFDYDVSLGMKAGNVSVYQGYGTTGLGNDKDALLRLNLSPFRAIENTTLTFNLSGAERIADLTLYETDSNVEWYSISSYANTYKASITGNTATFTLGDLTSGTHYYWLCPTVTTDAAAVGETIDAALTDIAYNVSGQETKTIELGTDGDPANAMKIFDVRQTIFYPWLTISGSDASNYRIPALITADDGSIIAAVDKRYGNASDLGNHKIDVVLRRSTDGGKTWNEAITIAAGDGSTNAAYGYGDPSFVKGKDGKLFCLFAAGANQFQGGNLKNIAMVTSTDNGVTWTEPVDITTREGKFTDNASLTSSFFVTSGKGLYTSDGVLMFLLDAYIIKEDKSKEETNFLLYSTDEGESWIIDENVVYSGANEAKLVELAPGKLLSSTRQGGGRGFNTGTYTKNSDGTCTFSWGTQWQNNTLTQGGAGNNQDIIVYKRDSEGKATVLFHTITGAGHKNLRLFMSTDQGTTWTEQLQVQPGGSRYSVMTILDNGDLGILLEDYSLETGREYPITFFTVSKDQLGSWLPLDAPAGVKVVYGTSAETVFGNWDSSKKTWTSKVSEGYNETAGVTLTAEAGSFDKFSNWMEHYNLAYKPAEANKATTLTLTAPDGYVIAGYTLLAAKAYSASHTYTLTKPDGTTVTPAQATTSSGYTTFEVTDINAKTTNFTVTTTSTSYHLAITDFVVTLAPAATYVVADENGEVWATAADVLLSSNNVSANMPTSLKRAFVTYDFFADADHTEAIKAINGLPTVYVKATLDAPFAFSTPEAPVWYFLESKISADTKKYLYANDNKLAIANETSTEKPYQWAFIGNPYSVKLLNKATKTYLTAEALNASANGGQVTNSLEADGSYNTFSLYGFTNTNFNASNAPENPFSLVLNGSSVTTIDGRDGLIYHSGITINNSLQLSNWQRANIEVVPVPTTWEVSLNYVTDIDNAKNVNKSYGSIFLPYDVTMPEGVTAWGVETTEDGVANLYLLEGGVPAMNGAILVYDGEATTITLPIAEGIALPEGKDNILTGYLERTERPTDVNVYVFSKGTTDDNTRDVGFFRYTGAYVPANKAILKVSEGSVRSFVFNFGPTTGIDAAALTRQSIEGTAYDLQGRRVNRTQHGVYILDGKKVIK